MAQRTLSSLPGCCWEGTSLSGGGDEENTYVFCNTTPLVLLLFAIGSKVRSLALVGSRMVAILAPLLSAAAAGGGMGPLCV